MPDFPAYLPARLARAIPAGRVSGEVDARRVDGGLWDRTKQTVSRAMNEGLSDCGVPACIAPRPRLVQPPAFVAARFWMSVSMTPKACSCRCSATPRAAYIRLAL